MAKKKDGTENDKRTNDILLGPLERPALAFFSKNMPAWVNSDMLTVLGFMGSLLTSFAYIMVGHSGSVQHNGWLFIASLGFIINWFGDSLDGSLARYRHMERPNFGYYTDHAIDGLTSTVIFIGIGLSGIVRFEVALFALVMWELLMMQVFLKTHATGVFEMTSIKVGPTEVRLLAIILNTVVYFAGVGRSLFTIDFAEMYMPMNIGSVVVLALGFAFLAYFIYQVISTGRKLAKLDEKKLADRLAAEASNARQQKKGKGKVQKVTETKPGTDFAAN